LNTIVRPWAKAPLPDSPIPGLHIVANLQVTSGKKLLKFDAFQQFIDQQIRVHELTKVGEVYHDFPNGGFTGVVCLSESHLSVHTWPEHNYLTFDVFLSNYLKDNRDITVALYEGVKEYFGGIVLFESILNR
jgi:S-adenosylmethionine decarboxylase